MPRRSRKDEVFDYLKAHPTEFTVRELCVALEMSYDTCLGHLNALSRERRITHSTAVPEGRGRPMYTFMYVS